MLRNCRNWLTRDANALYDLGVRCREGLGIPQDLKLAEACYLKAAEMGHTDTMNHNKFSLPKGIFKDLSGKEPFQYVPC